MKKEKIPMPLIEAMTKVYKESLVEVFTREFKEEEFMNRKHYGNSRQRAMDCNMRATERSTNILALTDARHQKEVHDINTSVEIKSLEIVMSDEDKAVSRGW
jgi:hypothetical protein